MKSFIQAAELKKIFSISMTAALVFVDFGLSGYPALAAAPGSTGPGAKGTAAGSRNAQTSALDVPIQGIKITINSWRGTSMQIFDLGQQIRGTDPTTELSAPHQVSESVGLTGLPAVSGVETRPAGVQEGVAGSQAAPDQVLPEGALLEELGQNIRDRRRTLNLTLAQMAQRTNVSLGYLSQIELGKNSPSIEVLYRISLGLGVHISSLLQGVDTPK
jgi:DNA-binding XRE family transcriptional regulator